MTRQVAVLLSAAAGLAAAGLVEPVNKGRQGIALRGYDPVAYFRAGAPAKGSSQFTHSWMNATWRFSSAENRDAFASDPAKYAPQFGGYCAWAVSNNYTADADPEAWKIVDGKLYVNYNKDVQKKWEQDAMRRIEAGNLNWPKLHK
jgi:YHS domain-containing protein